MDIKEVRFDRLDQLVFDDLVEFSPERGHITYFARRATLTPTDAMGALRKELIDTLGWETARVILTRYGFSCGYDDAKQLIESTKLSLSDEDFVLVGPRWHMFQGVAEVITRHLDTDTHHMHGEWRNSYEAEQHLRLFGTDSEPVCWTLAGYASGFATVAFGTPMICLEDSCLGQGDPCCLWRLIPADELGPEMEEIKRCFMPLNIKGQLDNLEEKVHENQRRLEASEERYRDLIEDLPEMVFAADGDGRLLQINKAGRETMGLAPERVPGARISDLVSMDQRKRVQAFLRRLRQSGSEQKLETSLCQRGGGNVPVQLRVNPVVKDGAVLGFRGIAVDITARQARERKLADYANRLVHREQQFHELINDALYIADAKGRLTFVNGRMARLLGIPAEEALNRRFSAFVDAASAERLQKDIDMCLRGVPSQPFEIPIPNAKGVQRIIEISTARLQDAGTATGVIGVARDITRRRELEVHLAQSNRLAALGQFASGIAHEINNPMGLISGFAEEMLDFLSEGKEVLGRAEIKTLKDGLRTVQEQAYRCKYITGNLLSFARKRRLSLEEADLAVEVREKASFYTEGVKGRGVTIAIEAPDEMPPVRTDSMLLGQVLLNLLKNADDAMGGTGTVRVRVGCSGAKATIEVLDEGPGLPPQLTDSIFDPFFTTKPPGKGTGLGLSISYGIVEDLGGEITCGNRNGGGAWFKVTLPIAGLGGE